MEVVKGSPFSCVEVVRGSSFSCVEVVRGSPFSCVAGVRESFFFFVVERVKVASLLLVVNPRALKRSHGALVGVSVFVVETERPRQILTID